MNKKKLIKRLGIALCIIAVPMTGWIMAYIQNNKPEVLEYYKNCNFNLDWKLTTQDSLLFNLEKIKFSTPFCLITSDLRNDIRTIGVYDNMGIIDYTSIDIKPDFSLDNIIFLSQKEIPKIPGPWPAGIMNRLSQGAPADSIIFSYIGKPEQLRELHHDNNFRSYTVYAETLSIRYGVNESPDISINQKIKESRPFSFAFLKDKDRDLLYFIVYGVNTEKVSTEDALSNDFLGEFLNWRNEVN